MAASYLPVSPSAIPSSKSSESLPLGRKIKTSANLTLKTTQLEKAANLCKEKITPHYQAQITSSSLSKDSYRAQIRVPSQSLKSLINALSDLGKVTHKKIRMEDVTESYIDLQALIKNKVALRDRLRGLLEKASKIEDILKIEQELSRVQAELDSMQARMKLMSSQVQFATISLSINRKRFLSFWN